MINKIFRIYRVLFITFRPILIVSRKWPPGFFHALDIEPFEGALSKWDVHGVLNEVLEFYTGVKFLAKYNLILALEK